MADYRAIETTTKALVHLLRTSYRPDDFGDIQLQFEGYVGENFKQPMTTGVSLLLYRVTVNGTYRTPPGRDLPSGRKHLPSLPLDLHYVATVWAREASMQHRIAGWTLRTFEDTPILPFGLLDAVGPGTFRPDEAIELVPAELVTEDLLRIWEVLIQSGYRLSIPYLVRNVRIESDFTESFGERVQERGFVIEEDDTVSIQDRR